MIPSKDPFLITKEYLNPKDWKILYTFEIRVCFDNRIGDESKQDTSDSSADDKEKIRDVIFVGTKPIMTYVTATLTQLSNQKTVTIKARGKRITQAVDVSQMIVKRMDSVGYIVSAVRIASDSLTSQDGRLRNVSTIEIDVTKT